MMVLRGIMLEGHAVLPCLLIPPPPPDEHLHRALFCKPCYRRTVWKSVVPTVL